MATMPETLLPTSMRWVASRCRVAIDRMPHDDAWNVDRGGAPTQADTAHLDAVASVTVRRISNTGSLTIGRHRPNGQKRSSAAKERRSPTISTRWLRPFAAPRKFRNGARRWHAS